MALATFEQVKDFLELKKTNVSDYPTLEILIDSMQSTFESSISRLFDFEERTEIFRIFDADGEANFWLPATPINSVTSVTVTSISGTDTPLTQGDDYFVYEQYIELTTAAIQGEKVTIVYVGGIIDQTSEVTFLATIPKDINVAAIRQIAFEYQNRDKLAVTSMALDGNVTAIPTLKLLTYTVNILSKYKNLGTGF